jgi:hypothetical protein
MVAGLVGVRRGFGPHLKPAGADDPAGRMPQPQMRSGDLSAFAPQVGQRYLPSRSSSRDRHNEQQWSIKLQVSASIVTRPTKHQTTCCVARSSDDEFGQIEYLIFCDHPSYASIHHDDALTMKEMSEPWCCALTVGADPDLSVSVPA